MATMPLYYYIFLKNHGTSISFELEKIYISSYKLLLLSDRFKIPSFYISIQQNLLESEVNVLYGRKISSSTKFFFQVLKKSYIPAEAYYTQFPW